jgi:hypothetical protein
MFNTHGFIVAGLGAVAVAAFTAVIRLVSPDPNPPPPLVVVHSLAMGSDGRVSQDRTVNTTDAVAIVQWAARVEYADGGGQVDGCVGAGVWPYDAGRRVATFPLSEWVGRESCTVGTLPRGVELRPRVVFERVGHPTTVKVGAAFMVRADGTIEAME